MTHKYPSPGLIKNISENFTQFKTIIIMVGLPLRGKSFISLEIVRFLSWFGFNIKRFTINHLHDLPEFEKDDVNGEEKCKMRKKCAFSVLNQCVDYLKNKNGNISIYDANNCSEMRRNEIKEFVKDNFKENKCKLIWIESIINEKELMIKFIDEHKKINSLDKSFENKLTYYKQKYNSLNSENDCYIKLINFKKFECNKIDGYIESKILFILANIRIKKAPLFFTRHGESVYNVEDKVGGDSPLSLEGQKYAKIIYSIIKSQPEFGKNMKIFCSTLKRSIETVQLSGLGKEAQLPIKWRVLSEIESGDCDGMSYSEIKEKLPEEYYKRKVDKLDYRYPKGESYRDLIMRLEPIILELLRSTSPVLVVGHRAVLRCLYGYFCGIESKKIPHLNMPLHTVLKLEPFAFGCNETRLSVNVVTGKTEVFRKKHELD